MNKFIILFSSFLLFACNSNKSDQYKDFHAVVLEDTSEHFIIEEPKPAEVASVDIRPIENFEEFIKSIQFKNKDLRSISIAKVRSNKEKYYQAVDSAHITRLFQDSTQKGPITSQYYYFSIQNKHTPLKAITLLEVSNYCQKIWYLVYNPEGQLLGKFAAATECKDVIGFLASSGAFSATNLYKQKYSLCSAVDNANGREFSCFDKKLEFSIEENGEVINEIVETKNYKKKR